MKNSRLRSPFCLALVLLIASLQACTHQPASTLKPAGSVKPAFELRLMVKTGEKADGLVPEALAQRAAQISKLTVRYLSASGGGWHALEMGCDERAQCDLGLQRLRSQPTEFASVEPEARASFGPGLPQPVTSR
jgi:hypothetical protein